MPQLMLMCSNSHVFPSGLGLEGPIHGLALSNNKSQCPYDGEMVAWPEGVFDSLEALVDYVSSSKDPAKTSRELAQELQEGGGKHLDEVSKINPKLAISALTTTLGLAQVTLELLRMFHSTPTTISTTNINRQNIITTYNNYCIQAAQKKP